ncbi:GFA family protein [Shewanella psychropiezotolerans]|uniref:GFA family protein n=1 Tax=Shewanella psychropiezotolerans TaxID=2593655 RepID=A0ABX5X3E2_9GAMM|nr:GFA family protein [Shewanella psychropiezotolerans]QDO85799.1 GFA family protein [Shewanella psychropiezotolerans]
MMQAINQFKASCHCGAVELKINLPEGLVDPRRCDCSMCRRRGSIVASVPLSDLEVVKGQEVLSLYQFNTRSAKHFFCSKCGIYTHHQRRSNPHLYAFNVACLEGDNPFQLQKLLQEGVTLYDGINHPADKASNIMKVHLDE